MDMLLDFITTVRSLARGLRVILDPCQAPRIPAPSELLTRRSVVALADAQPDPLLANKGYDGDVMRQCLIVAGIPPVNLSPPKRTTTRSWSQHLERD